MRYERVKFALIHQRWPTGRVEVEDGSPVDKPRRARSIGKPGGKRAEQARDQMALDALEGQRLTISDVAALTGSERTNCRKRLLRLAAQGLVEPPPRCCPDRGWALTMLGREKALIDAPAPPTPAVRWVKPVTSYLVVTQAGHDGNVARFG